MIGISTYFNVVNYGAVLQAYAMQEIISEVAKDETVGIIDYCPIKVKKNYSLISTTSIKSFVDSVYNLQNNLKRKRAFSDFRNKRLRLVSVQNGDELNWMVLGSDQIWNPRISGGFDQVFFGRINGNKAKHVGAYAASIGIDRLEDAENILLRDLIRSIDVISVREQSAKRILQQLTQREVFVDLDPTLLIGREKWEKLAEHRTDIKKPYVLVYSLSGYDLTIQTALEVSRKVQSEPIEVCIKNKKPFQRFSYRVLNDVSPAEFIGLIKNADAVVTDSFHGSVFSILFHKSLFTIPNRTKGSRVTELLEKLDINKRIVTENMKLDEMEIDYEQVDIRLTKLATESKDRIRQMLSSI